MEREEGEGLSTVGTPMLRSQVKEEEPAKEAEDWTQKETERIKYPGRKGTTEKGMMGCL